MARAPDERYNQAYELYKSGMKLVEIASQLNLPEGTVRRWKSTHKWDNERSDKKSERSHKKKGGQPGNKNAVDNDGGAPEQNKNAEKHGFFSKYLPEETFSIIQEIEKKDPLDILWENIQIAYAAIVRAQQIMHVRDKDDLTKELKRSRVKTNSRNTEKTSSESSDEEYEYELQFAWDKQANFLQAQARAQTSLNGMIKQYEELCKSDLATEEQKARIRLIKAQTDKLSGSDNQAELKRLDEILSEIKGVI